MTVGSHINYSEIKFNFRMQSLLNFRKYCTDLNQDEEKIQWMTNIYVENVSSFGMIYI